MRFSQATPKTHAQYGGSGLGLFISRQLTELHGGQIGVGSEAGVGSTFGFYIKCRRAPVPGDVGTDDMDASSTVQSLQNAKASLPLRTERPLTPASPPPLPTLDFSKIHVLIVEDNLVNQKVLSKQLKKIGCPVSVADHGGFALSHIEKTRYWRNNPDGVELSVVLMDLEMPVMDGLTCVKRIRELEQEGTIVGRIPVIAVTANVRMELVETAKSSGMDDVVSKPFRIPELMGKITLLLSSGSYV